jgi:short-subunit dehydrogenase
MSEYCASKFALQGLSQSLRAELAPLGIGLLVVSPGTTETEFFEHILDPAQRSPWARTRGIASADVARRTVEAMRRGRSEIILNPRGKLLVWINRFAPSLVDRFLTRYG